MLQRNDEENTYSNRNEYINIDMQLSLFMSLMVFHFGVSVSPIGCDRLLSFLCGRSNNIPSNLECDVFFSWICVVNV